MLARAGMDVVVLERDAGAVPGSPDDAWQAWERRGVAQFKQAHFLHPGGVHILDSQLPDVKQALLVADGTSFDLLTLLGLYWLGRRVRGPTLGVVLAYAWAAGRSSHVPPHPKIARTGT